MKKSLMTILILSLFITIHPLTSVSAQISGQDYTSNISCQNQSDTLDASVELLFYQEDTGKEISLGSEVIPAGMSTNFILSGLENGSVGSVVVKSGQPVTCAVEYSAETTGTYSNPYRFSATKGFDENEIGPMMYVSQIEKGFYGWNSYIAIQNTEDYSVDITVNFVDRYGVSYPEANFTIPAFANHVIYLQDLPTLPSNFIGGASISADDGITPLAVSTAFFNSGTSPSTSQIHAWNGSSKGSNILYAPYIVMNYYLYNSGIMVQNIGESPTSFKIIYTFNGKDYIYQHQTELGVGEAKDFYLPNVAVLSPVNLIPNNLRFGKAIIEATNIDGTSNPNGELIANVNQENRGGSGIPIEFAGNGGTYAAFPSTYSSNTYYIAKWMVHIGGFSSGFNVSNFSDTDVTCDFIFPTDPDANFSRTIEANSFFSKWAPNIANLDDGYNAGVKIDCTDGVFVITNASNDPNVGKYGDSFYQMGAGIEFLN